MSEPNAQEPTMEEILASIRRIISEDEPAAGEAAPEAGSEPEAAPEPAPLAAAPEPVALAPAPEPEPEADDVLELTEVAPEPAPAAAVESLGDLDLYPPADARPKTEPAPAPAPVRAGEPLVSGAVAASTGAAFGQLAQRLVMPKEGRTLEDVVREMLNPLLKAWLDENLPAIVQAKVEEEVERIARRHV
jgi:cell pole-organizing protein PopZ